MSGCGCDIPSVTYQYTWEPNVWSKYYSDAPEILQYFKNIVDKYDLKRYIKLRHAVRNAAWDEDKGKWNLDITDLATATNLQEECDIFINCGGLLK
jgi:cation diffusion facilitator CzcD-associated flavoprotein CzcO